MEIKPGDVVAVGGAASVQFNGDRRMLFRIIRVNPKPTYHGWVWLDGYQLDRDGAAVERREIFVRPAGLRVLRPRGR